MLRVLRQRNFALLWCGQVISTIGDWLLWIALPFHVYALTGSALATGAMFIVNNLPTLLFGSLAGVFVDRWDRRRTMIGADLLRALLLLPLLLTHASEQVWFIYPVAFLIASVARFFHPAKSAITPTLVNQEHLLAANTLNSMGSDLAMLAGPAFGGILFAQIGFAGVVLLDAVSFLASALLIYLITVVPAAAPSNQDRAKPATLAGSWQKLWQEWQAGLRLVTAQCTLTAIFVFSSFDMVGSGIILVLWAIFVKTVLHGGALEYGWVQVAVAIGGLVGAYWLTRVQTRFSPRLLIAGGGSLVGLLLLATFHAPTLGLILGLQLVMGFASVGYAVTTETLLQTSATHEYLGRVFGAYHTTGALAVLFGQILGSLLGDRLGIVVMLDLAAGFILVSGVVAFLLLPK